MKSPEALFKVNLESVSTLFGQGGRGFYVPAYQRRYSWGKEQIQRLLSDLCSGLQAWPEDEDSVTFLGSIILLRDELGLQVQPRIVPHLPNEVLVVVDGQQRLSTLALLGVCLHDAIRIATMKIKPKLPGSGWLMNNAQTALNRLPALFQLDTGHGQLRHYPKVIRAFTDTWSRDTETAIYASPVARFISEYQAHTENPARKAYKLPKDAWDGAKQLSVVQKQMADALNKDIATGIFPGEDGTLFATDVLAESEGQRRLFRDYVPEDLALAAREGDRYSDLCLRLLYLMAFSNYLLTRCTLTVTRPTEERYAFDLFESLNTTGQQLTAYETFVPLVVSSEGISEYQSSASHEILKEIGKFVPSDLNYDDRLKVTDALLVPFALAESGDRLRKGLSHQRAFLRKNFEPLPDVDSRRAFLRHMLATVRFLRDAWHYGRRFTPASRLSAVQYENQGSTLVCINFLSNARHDITVGVLTRFYAAVLEDGEEALEASRDFCEAAKAVAAFFVLYRWHSGTRGLPDVYRKLMESGNPGLEVPPMARRSRKSELEKRPLVNDLRRHLANALLERCASRGSWVDTVKLKPLKNAALRRFALFAETAKTHGESFFSMANWVSELDAELIAPGVNPGNWYASLYEGERTELIGNLTLLAGSLRSPFADQSWSKKQAYLQFLGGDDSDTALLNNAGALGFDTSELTDAAQRAGIGGFPLAQLEQAAHAEQWNTSHVESRSGEMASSVWDQLAPWLGL